MPSAIDVPSPGPLVSQILSIIGSYRHISINIPDGFSKFLPELQDQLAGIVDKNQPVRFILPAFPFKAPADGNTRKTLGSLPDKAEEIALQTLNAFADSIAEIYDGGADVVIVSDASVYGDILNISDADAFAYHLELKNLASSLGLTHLQFTRPGALAGITPREAKTLEEYSDHVQTTRDLLDGLPVEVIGSGEDENTQATSKHYDIALPKTKNSEVVKAAMIKRGKAYANLISSSSQSAIRLSIHESNNVGKITVDLFSPSTNPEFLTPWHGAVALFADASVRIVDASVVDKTKFDVVVDANGRPWLLRERCDLFNWLGMELDFEPLFPCGMLVKPREGHGPYKFEDVDMKLVRRLALSTAPLLLRGFTMEVEKEVFRGKARELGEIQMWPFGDILEVRENADLNMNNVLTREAMPFHYDGVFKTAQDPNTGEWVSIPPLFQMFRNRAADQQVGGLTLFSSSRNMLPLLNKDTITLDELRKLRWKTFTVANQAFGGQELHLPFITAHPETGADTFRFHEPWPESKCVAGSSEPTIVEVVGWAAAESDALCESLTRLMYDRRVVYRHQWSEGDFIFNDNAMTHHTRTAFESGHRELWRVHVS